MGPLVLLLTIRPGFSGSRPPACFGAVGPWCACVLETHASIWFIALQLDSCSRPSIPRQRCTPEVGPVCSVRQRPSPDLDRLGGLDRHGSGSEAPRVDSRPGAGTVRSSPLSAPGSTSIAARRARRNGRYSPLPRCPGICGTARVGGRSPPCRAGNRGRAPSRILSRTRALARPGGPGSR